MARRTKETTGTRQTSKRRLITDEDVKKNIISNNDEIESYNKEENKAALLAQIEEIEEAYKQGNISFKDKSAQIYAIRFRLQDKFELQRSDKEKRIIVVPAKHLFICPHTNRECSNMPPKEVCLKYYNLVEKE